MSDEYVCKESEMTATAGRSRQIEETTDLGIGMLIAESEDGAYQPVAAVSTIREGREIAANDMRRRMRQVDGGGDPLCPSRYTVWAQGATGEYATVAELEAN
jgi:hypothetical protein